MTNVRLNGEPAEYIDIHDRGLQYGDGFFTTIRVVQGRMLMWKQHWERLCRAAQILHFTDFTGQVSERSLLDDCQALLTQYPAPDAVIRISITRGQGSRGYTPSTQIQASVLVAISTYPEHYANWRSQGVRLQLAQQRLGYQPMLGGAKTLNRLEQVLLKQELSDYPDMDDLLALDCNAMVAETSIANIAWQYNGEWFTPRLEGTGVRGLAMDFFIQHTQAVVGDYPLDSLLSAEQVVISNCLLGFANVAAIRVNATRTAHFSVLSNFTEQLTRRMCDDE